jgi:hypothetical protein
MRQKLNFGLLLAIFVSCQNIENKPKTTENPVVEIKRENSNDNEYSFLENVPERKTPLKDSTNFDNFSSDKSLTKNQLALLQFEKVANDPDQPIVNYKIDISPNFRTYVFTYFRGEHELFSTLVNYDKSFKLISKLDISYDEIAESWFRTESQITKNEIIVNELNYTEEVEKSTKTTYTIEKNGQIVLKK